jgi:hypothetical protein
MNKYIYRTDYFQSPSNMLAPRVEPTLAVKFETAKLNFSLVFVPATCPALATLLKAPFSQAVPALTYLSRIKTEL